MNDLRLAARALRQSPVLSAAAVLSLALGIGANTAIFSVVNALMLRSLPVPDPQRLVTVSSAFALGHGFKAGAGMNYDMWNRMKGRIRMFDGGFAWSAGRVDLSHGGVMQPADALFTSGSFFTTLDVPALIGRTFTVADDVRGGGPDGLVAVISYGLWQRRFGGAGTAIGTAMPVDGVPCTVIGVMPPGFFGIEVGQPFDVALPLAIEPDVRGPQASLHHPSALMLTVMLRLRHGQPIDAATAAIRVLQPEVLGATDGNVPNDLPQFLKDPYVLVPAATGTSDRSGLRRQYVRPLLTILAVVVLVLLVACVNIANLLLARATARRHEMSVRVALGAPRWRLASQPLVESLMLSTVGALVGLLFAAWASRLVVASLSTADRQVFLNLDLDWRVLSVTAAATVATAMLFGTAPALRAAHASAIEALKTQGRGGRRSTFSSSLVVCQVALSLVLLFGAGLFLSTFNRLARLPLGFQPERVLVADVDTARAHADHATRLDYYHELIEALKPVPGVAHVAGSTITPFSRATRSPLFNQPGRVHEHPVSPGYFAVYGMDMRAGRDFDARDMANAPRVVVVSEAYARKFFADRSPLGAIVDPGACGSRGRPCSTIVGVVSDAVFGPPRGGARPTIYVPLAQSAGLLAPVRTEISISARSASGSVGPLARSVAEALTTVNRNLAFSFRPLEQDVGAALAQERLVARVSAFFGALALALSALGLYGITAYAVARRRTEIGIRLALGASGGRIVRLVLRRVAALIGVGLTIGIAVCLWASKFVETLLYGLEPHDPVTFAGAAIILAAVGLVASWLPAFRASMLDAARVLRQS